MVEELIKKRRSIRSYTEKDIPKETIEELVYLANISPSPANVQDRHFVVIEKSSPIRKVLYEAGCFQEHILTAPVLLVCVSKLEFMSRKRFLEHCIPLDMDMWGATSDNYREHDTYLRNYKNIASMSHIQDVTIALQTLIIAAEAKGLGTCWIGAFDEMVVKEVLSLPKKYRVFAMLTMGYPKEYPSYSRRVRDTSEILHWGKW